MTYSGHEKRKVHCMLRQAGKILGKFQTLAMLHLQSVDSLNRVTMLVGDVKIYSKMSSAFLFPFKPLTCRLRLSMAILGLVHCSITKRLHLQRVIVIQKTMLVNGSCLRYPLQTSSLTVPRITIYNYDKYSNILYYYITTKIDQRV